MIKKCSNCGREASPEAKFCAGCGNSNFIFSEVTPPSPTPPPVQTKQPIQQTENFSDYDTQQIHQPITPTHPIADNELPPKKSSGKNIAIIVLSIVMGLLIVFIIAALATGFLSFNKKYVDITEEISYIAEKSNDNEETTKGDKENTEKPTKTGSYSKPKVEYTSGNVENGVYSNEWANIYINFDGVLPKASQDVYDSMTSTGAEVGIALQNTEMPFEQLSVLFEKNTFNITVEDTLNQISGYYENLFKLGFGESYELYEDYFTFSSDEVFTMTIGGETFTCITNYIEADEIDFHMEQTIALREKDGYFIELGATTYQAGYDSTELFKLIDSIA